MKKFSLNKFVCLLLCTVMFFMCGCKGKESTVNLLEDTDLSKVEVGNSLIAEITAVHSETFDGDSVNDISRPTNSYLPAGTVDYCSDTVINHAESKKQYRLLRYGKRTYEGNVKVYEGKLPESNTIITESISSNNKYTTLTFQTDYKAPFTLELKEQAYKDPTTQNYNISAPEYSYVEITFFYCTDFFDDFDFSNNELFSHHEFIQNQNNAVLKLYLKNKNAFYGWYAEYDEFDMLSFNFLEPTTVYVSQNEYGYTLNDATIVIDAGHGGKDSGAVNGSSRESSLNLALARRLKQELQSIGVNVIMTRTDNSDVYSHERVATAFEAKPDMVISIHRNAGSGNGFHAFYYNAYTFSAAKHITSATNSYDLYSSVRAHSWHYFFLSRIPYCPSVLTENGFMTSETDVENMHNEEFEQTCAKAITKGIIDFYINIPRS